MADDMPGRTDSTPDSDAPVDGFDRSEATARGADAPNDADEATGSDGGRPEVVVPMDLYKIVTVFSTLISIALVVGGMIALDSATARATRSAGEVNLPVAMLGVAAIVLGAATYAFAARFRAAGMGNPKDADDES